MGGTLPHAVLGTKGSFTSFSNGSHFGVCIMLFVLHVTVLQDQEVMLFTTGNLSWR